MRWTRTSAVLLFFVVLLLAAGGWAQQKESGKLVILFTHDLHSYFSPHRVLSTSGSQTEEGGYARLYSVIQEQRAIHGAKTLLVDAGDFSMGTLFHTSFFREASELRFMGRMGYDAVTFGNHDFDFHSDGLAKMLQVAKSKGEGLPALVASNIGFSESGLEDMSLKQAFGDYPVKEYTLLERNGVRIGLFGIMGKDAAEDTPFSKPVTFADPIQNSRRLVDILKREKAEVIICLSHSGTSEVKKHSEDENLARAVPEIDVIISGHTHTVLPKPIIIGKTIIVSSGCYGAYLGVLELGLPGKEAATVTSYSLHKITKELPDDPRVTREIAGYKEIVDQNYLAPYRHRFNDAIAESDFDLESLSSAYAHPGEMGLGNMITDAYRYAVEKAEGAAYEYIHVVVEPLGHIRDSLLKGKISVADVFQVLSLGLGLDGNPGYPLVAFHITGDELKKLLEVETSVALLKADAHLQLSGVQFTFNPNRVPFDRVVSAMIREKDGDLRPLEPKRLYRVCINLYTANMVDYVGKVTYGFLSIMPKDREGRPLGDLKKAIVDADRSAPGVQELKEWAALSTYMKTFPDSDGNGIPNIPLRYRQPEGRVLATPTWNPIALIRGGNYITYGFLVIGILILGAVFLLIRAVLRKLNCIYQR